MPLSGDWGRLASALREATHVAEDARGMLSELGQRGVEIAQDKLGHYQEGWPELAEGTQQERRRLGFPPNDPLLRTGGMREAIRVLEDTSDEVVFGIAEGDEHHGQGLTQEFGSVAHNVPPRPFLGPTAEELAAEIPDRLRGVIERRLGD